MLSGISPYRHGGVGINRRLSEKVNLLPEMLQEIGYHTIALSANPWVSPQYGMGQGFEEFHLYNTDNELILYDIMKLLMRLIPWEVFHFREYLPTFAYVPIGELVEDVIEILQKRDSSRPLFLYFHTVDPHGPYQPPRQFVQEEDTIQCRENFVSYWDLTPGVTINLPQREAIIARYDGEIAYTDSELGKLFHVLREFDLFDECLIIITSDHGEQFQEHELWRHSNSLYQQLLHVPLIIKYPGQIEGSVVNAWVAMVDIVPSILQLIGFNYEGFDGRSLFDEDDDVPFPIVTYRMDVEKKEPDMKGVLSQGWKLMYMTENDKVHKALYHVELDPLDTEDLSATHPEIAAELAGLLQDYEAASQSTFGSEHISLQPAEIRRLQALGYVE
jgi:arylsulfatase A-like enzyme